MRWFKSVSRPWRFVRFLSPSSLPSWMSCLQLIASVRCAPTNHINSDEFSSFWLSFMRTHILTAWPHVRYNVHQANNGNCANGRRISDSKIRFEIKMWQARDNSDVTSAKCCVTVGHINWAIVSNRKSMTIVFIRISLKLWTAQSIWLIRITQMAIASSSHVSQCSSSLNCQSVSSTDIYSGNKSSFGIEWRF